MLEAPPPIISLVPDVPSGFSIAAPIKLLRLAPDCRPSGGEIVICGRRNEERYRLGPWLPPPPTLMDEVAGSLSFQLGPFQVGTGAVQGPRSIGAGISLSLKF